MFFCGTFPHHPVIHPYKPSKVRVVFDCAAKCKGVCLNDALMQGPNLTNSLIGVRYFTRLLVSPNILHRTVTKRAGSPSTARTILLSLSRIQLHEADEQRRFVTVLCRILGLTKSRVKYLT